MLLDWVNTIDEQRCLMLCEIDDLRDGLVFADLIKNILKKLNMFTDKVKLKLISIENMNTEERFRHLLFMMSTIIHFNEAFAYFSVERLCKVNKSLLF